jgi:hypothetical protein
MKKRWSSWIHALALGTVLGWTAGALFAGEPVDALATPEIGASFSDDTVDRLPIWRDIVLLTPSVSVVTQAQGAGWIIGCNLFLLNGVDVNDVVFEDADGSAPTTPP